MNISNIRYNDIANGVGVRTSVFVSGCRHRCEGCFNQVAWEFDAGTPFDDDVMGDILRSLEPDHVDGLSVLGGEPLEPENQDEVLRLVRGAIRLGKSVWMWTGFTYEDLCLDCRASVVPHRLWNILDCVDVLVDGPFVRELADPSLRFRGSSNQRLIDMSNTYFMDDIRLWDDGNVRGRW